MSKREEFKDQKDLVLKYVKKNGLDKIGEFAVFTGVPLIYLYEFILEDTNDHKVKEHCNFKIKTLRNFYGGIY